MSLAGLEIRQCKLCPAKVAFVPGPNGKLIPLDVKSAVYTVQPDATGKTTAVPVEAYVTHFATCPNANAFSGKNGRKP